MGLLEFCLRFSLVTLEPMNGGLNQSLWCGRSRVSHHGLAGEFFDRREGLGQLALQDKKPRSNPGHQPIWITVGWNQRKLLFRPGDIALQHGTISFRSESCQRVRG